ncbi:NIPSNAP family protein [Streptomyces sp. NPDC058232]|uniref:NIPSNAP family protein n=1 Tax=Streptomyces sp. NPDC058232 TaxID=3346393 RepID=UPI0036E0480F
MAPVKIPTRACQLNLAFSRGGLPKGSIGLPVQKPILGGFFGYFVTEFGTQNELNHFWVYRDLEDRRSWRGPPCTELPRRPGPAPAS